MLIITLLLSGCDSPEIEANSDPINLVEEIQLPDLESYEQKPTFYFSTYAPEDELYEPVLAIQQGCAYDGMDKLRELSKQGNVDTVYSRSLAITKVAFL